MGITKNHIALIFVGFSMAFVAALVMMPILISVSHKKKWLDDPDHRKIHTEPIPRLGGIGMFVALAISGAAAPFLARLISGMNGITREVIAANLPFIGAVTIIFLVGALDDFANLRASFKLIGQIVAAAVVCAGGALVSRITVPFVWKTLELGWFAWPFTILWIVGITNAINLIDGIDGLAATVGLVAFVVYGVVFLITGHTLHAMISFIVAGSLAGYLFFNFPPAKIFMGDSGSHLLGFLLAVLPLIAEPRSGTSLVMPFTLLTFAMLDVFFAIARRIRKGIPFSHPDKEHTHHKLLALGLNNRRILALVAGLMVAVGIMVVLFFLLPREILSPIIIATWVLVAALFFVLHHVYHRRVGRSISAGDNIVVMKSAIER